MSIHIKVLEAIGAQRLMLLLSVRRSAIGEASRKGFFPACWYQVLKAECDQMGVELSMDDFRFKRPGRGK